MGFAALRKTHIFPIETLHQNLRCKIQLSNVTSWKIHVSNVSNVTLTFDLSAWKWGFALHT